MGAWDLAGDVKHRQCFLSGAPGTGKSEVLVHAAKLVVDRGGRVLFLAPTGADLASAGASICAPQALLGTPHVVPSTLRTKPCLLEVLCYTPDGYARLSPKRR